MMGMLVFVESYLASENLFFMPPHSGPKSQKPGHEGCSLVIRAVNSWFLMKSCT
jgi:hypothetical protein